MRILVIDAQGGGLGKQIITMLKKECEQLHIIAVGTNSAATSAMLKAGADEAATGENSVVVTSRMADVIVGPIGMVIADSMLGEITPTMALAIGQSSAKKILIPFFNCDNYVVGTDGSSVSQLVRKAVDQIIEIMHQG